MYFLGAECAQWNRWFDWTRRNESSDLLEISTGSETVPDAYVQHSIWNSIRSDSTLQGNPCRICHRLSYMRETNQNEKSFQTTWSSFPFESSTCKRCPRNVSFKDNYYKATKSRNDTSKKTFDKIRKISIRHLLFLSIFKGCKWSRRCVETSWR